jgi:uncharacterized protein YbbC (DUF1343 family)/CubicO group peptidase (beta-lactamase class C family)
MDPERLARIDAAVAKAIADKRAPGAVVLVLRRDRVVFRKAYGDRQVQPTREPMTADTVFDMASLTKPIATATAVMLLIEQGKLRLEDRVAKHLPAFGKHGKDAITVEQLLLHTSGLIADNPVADYAHGKKKAFENICDLKLRSAPGSRFTYSDVGFIVLGELVEKISGQPLDAFCRGIFAGIGMKDTTFRPGKELAARAAPTERDKGEWLRGVVHDPRSRAMGGVAGHAGLFSTADDLATYAINLLNDGGLLKKETAALFTTPRDVPRGKRTPGWDARTSYSAPRGRYFGGFGHTGFTGTSIWMDPASQTAVIILTNRVHPDGKGNVTALRSQVADIVAEAIVKPPFPPGRRPAARTGLDVLQGEGFKRLAGKRVGLVTNHTGVNADGASAIDLLHQAPGVKLVALFSPEHGIRGLLDERVDDGKDEKTGLPIYSLYGKTRRPTKEQLQGIDTLVYDIQDIGCRFYTYITTLGYVLEEAAKHNVEVLVLDRPNPIGGVAVEGPILDKKSESFVAYHPLPVRHGLTVGELALLFNTERKIGAKLSVVKAENWRRGDLFDRTGLVWRNPSPNMRSLTAALLYPGVGLLETTNLSVGRGTDRPFEVLGAPWMDGRKVAEALNVMELPGVRFVPTRFTPASSVHAKKECGGVQIYISDWAKFESLPVGFALAQTLRQLYPTDWQTKNYNRLLGNAAIFDAVNKGESASALLRLAEPGRKAFLEVRKRYLLYGD